MDGKTTFPPGTAPRREFTTTHWSMVMAARDGSPTQAAAAWETLCYGYWYPLYAYMRRTGHGPHDAQDLTQGFFAILISERELAGAAPDRGKFRSYLLGALKHYLSDERKKASAQKRGGGQTFVSIDEMEAESRYQVEPVENATPESLFDRAWGLAVLSRAMERLERRYADRGNADLFHSLQPFLAGSGREATYSDVAAGIGITEGNLKVTIHRLRKEYGAVLRAELGQIVGTEAEIDDEIRRLILITSG